MLKPNQEISIRQEALRAALQIKPYGGAAISDMYRGPGGPTAATVISDAKQIEEYLRGSNGAAAPKRKAKR